MKKFDNENLIFDIMAAFCILTSFSLLTIAVWGVGGGGGGVGYQISIAYCLFPFSKIFGHSRHLL